MSNQEQEAGVVPELDNETVENLNEMELFNRILKLRAALKICSVNAEQAIIKRPDNVSEVAWMASHLGDIFRFCQNALGADAEAGDDVISEPEKEALSNG